MDVFLPKFRKTCKMQKINDLHWEQIRSENWVFSCLNQPPPYFCDFHLIYLNGWLKIGKFIEISRLTARNFKFFANFSSPISINRVETTKKWGKTDLNARKLKIHCSFRLPMKVNYISALNVENRWDVCTPSTLIKPNTFIRYTRKTTLGITFNCYNVKYYKNNNRRWEGPI